MNIEQIIKQLRGLYLDVSPDENGEITNRIDFNWATFRIEPKQEKIEFYLIVKDSLETFIRSKFTEYQEKVRETIKDMKNGHDIRKKCSCEFCLYDKALDEVLDRINKLN